MKIVKLMGGLGNQMFQCAFGLALARATMSDVFYDLSFFQVEHECDPSDPAYDTKGNIIRRYELDIFPVSLNRVSPRQVKRCVRRLFGISVPRFVMKMVVKITGHSPNVLDVTSGSVFNRDHLARRSNCHYVGYFQSEKYFAGVEEEIRSAFRFTNPPVSKYRDMIATDSSTPVAVHIRRGDYLRVLPPHELCDVDYYRQAIDYIAERVPNPRFYVFSEEHEWAAQNLELNHPAVFVHHDQGVESYVDMWLMSLCSHNIIANSSYSWWSGWLNGNPDKIVVAPSPWMEVPGDYICDGWITMPKNSSSNIR